MTNPVKRLLMSGDGDYFSASNTDLYHLTTGQALQSMRGWHTVGNIVLRGGRTSTYTVIAGLRHIMEALADFRFDAEFIEWAKSFRKGEKPLFDVDYLNDLRTQPFNVKVSMMPDGSVAFPGPIGRIEGDALHAKWIDTIISDFLRRGSSIATKAARLKWVADKADILVADNSMRRSNDTGGLLSAEIPVMIGLVGTSNMRAAMENGLIAVGTMDHWYVKLKMDEYFDLHPEADAEDIDNQRRAQQHAFRSYMHEFPEDGSLLIDTLGVEYGLRDAIVVLKEFMPSKYALRIDSGDLAKESIWARQILNDEKLSNISLSLTGGLRAVNLDSLIQQGAKIKSTGIGEYFQYGGEIPRKADDLYEPRVNVEIVTKLGYARSPSGREFKSIKLSETPAKASHPGILDRFRFVEPDRLDKNKQVLLGDVEVDLCRHNWEEGPITASMTSIRLDTPNKALTFPIGTRLERPIVPILNGPKLANENLLSINNSRARFAREFGMMDESLKAVNGSHSGCPAGTEKSHHLAGYTQVIGQQVVARM